MAIPTVVGVGTAANSTTGNIVPTLPSGWAADDIHLCVVEQSAVNAFTTMSGWTLVTNCQQKVGSTATDGNIQVFWKRAAGGDTDPTVTGTANHTSARIIGIRGCITSGNPWDVTNGGTDATADTSVVVTGNTTTVADCLVVIFVGTGTDVASTTEISGFANSDLGSVTERMDNWTSDGNGGGFGCATGTKATTGSYGNTTATLVNSANKAYCTIALKPATSTVKQLAALGVG